MISRRLIGALLSSSVLLTGCAAGGQAPTRIIKQVTDGVEKDVGDRSEEHTSELQSH